MNTCIMNHKMCGEFKKNGASGMGCAYLVKYENNKLGMVVGKDRTKKYNWNICAGHQEDIDGNCYLKTLIRESKEEFKLPLIYGDHNFNNIFKNVNGKIRYFINNRNPIFIGILPTFSREDIRKLIKIDLINKKLPFSYKEMVDIEIVDLLTLKTPEGKQLKLTQFAQEVIDKIKRCLAKLK